MDIGRRIKEIADQKNLSQKQVGDLIKDIQQNVGNDYKKPSLSFDRLLLYSKALNHNFLQYYYDDEPFKMYREEEHKIYQNQINILKEQLENANKTIALQKAHISTQQELIETQRDMIAQLKS